MSQFPDAYKSWTERLLRPYQLYAGLLRGCDPELGRGGSLLWVGELDENGCAAMQAANIAGAASFGATVDPEALRHANRDGVADFLVTSLDEALRILKNEIRKQRAVSVGVSVTPETILAEMQERGVLPDLLPPPDWSGGAELAWYLAHGARRVEVLPLPAGWSFKAWGPAPAEFDGLAATALPEDDHLNRRWLRLSPRYLGPAARRVRSLACSPEVEARLAEALAGHRSH